MYIAIVMGVGIGMFLDKFQDGDSLVSHAQENSRETVILDMNQVAVPSTDVKRSIDFYTRLGLKEIVRTFRIGQKNERESKQHSQPQWQEVVMKKPEWFKFGLLGAVTAIVMATPAHAQVSLNHHHRRAPGWRKEQRQRYRPQRRGCLARYEGAVPGAIVGDLPDPDDHCLQRLLLPMARPRA